MTFIIATHNKHKVTEFRRILEPLGVSVVSQSEAGIDADIIEDGTTFAENAEKKARAVSEAGNCVAIADDSGICIDAFGGAPGIYSARFLGEDTPYTEKNAIVLNRLKDVPDEQRTARYVCAICCIFLNEDIISTEGVCEGKMGYEPKGSNGFGYDPIFVYGDKSLAEISDEEKDKISHRGIALKKFVVELKKYLDKQ
ncbi:MAG: RdgB/HAM1 family non-canonical purine NTP pyrophosphatase [Oscillospiraceae bacterium]|nr:RdgB/HAM1 family non-canonical purine NTP pyrophosphatase [Oscillospiraceae bacterium]